MNRFRRFTQSKPTFRVRRDESFKIDNSYDPVDEDGNNALYIAAKEGDNSKVRQLLVPEEFVDIHRQNFAGNDALMMAACHGHLKVVKNLLAAGAGVLAKNNQGETALELAKRKNYAEIADWILMNKTNLIRRNKSSLELSSFFAAECREEANVNSSVLVVNDMTHNNENLSNTSYRDRCYKASIERSEIAKYFQEKTKPLAQNNLWRSCHNENIHGVAMGNDDRQIYPVLDDRNKNEDRRTYPISNERFKNQNRKTYPMLNEMFENQERQADDKLRELFKQAERENYDMFDRQFRNRNRETYPISRKQLKTQESQTYPMIDRKRQNKVNQTYDMPNKQIEYKEKQTFLTFNEHIQKEEEHKTVPMFYLQDENDDHQTYPRSGEQIRREERQTYPVSKEQVKHQKRQNEKHTNQECQICAMLNELVHLIERPGGSEPTELFHSLEYLAPNETTTSANSQAVIETSRRTKPPTRSKSFSHTSEKSQNKIASTKNATCQLHKHNSMPNIPVLVQNVYFGGDKHCIAMNKSCLYLKNNDKTDKAEDGQASGPTDYHFYI